MGQEGGRWLPTKTHPRWCRHVALILDLPDATTHTPQRHSAEGLAASSSFPAGVQPSTYLAEPEVSLLVHLLSSLQGDA